MSLRCFARFWRNRFSWSASFSSWITSGLTFTFTFSWSASSSTWITSGRSKSTTGGGTPPSRWRTTFHLRWNTSNIFLSSSLGAEQWTWQTLIVKLQSTRWRWKGTGQAERAKNTEKCLRLCRSHKSTIACIEEGKRHEGLSKGNIGFKTGGNSFCTTDSNLCRVYYTL